MKWPTDSDGTFAVPWYVTFAIKFIPAPIGPIVKLIIDIIDKLPVPQQADVVSAFRRANLSGDDSVITEALHDAVVSAREVGDHIK